MPSQYIFQCRFTSYQHGLSNDIEKGLGIDIFQMLNSFLIRKFVSNVGIT